MPESDKPIEPVKVLHLISNLSVGGAEQSLCRLVKDMDGSRFHCTVVSMTDVGPVGKAIQQTGCPVYAIGMKKGMADPRGILRLERIIHRIRPHILQCWMYHANLLGLMVAPTLPVIWNIRCSDMDLRQYRLSYRLSVRAGAIVSKFPRAVISNSESGRIWHEKLGYRPRRWVTIPNGFDTTIYRPDAEAAGAVRKWLNIPQSTVLIGMVARFDPMKDHAGFFMAAKELFGMYPNTHFVLAGRDIHRENPRARSLLQGMRFQEKFHLLGERKDVRRIMAALDILCSSSAYGEGFPNVIGEAMAVGIPCVVTDTGDSKELIGDTGIVVPARNPDALCDGWIQLIKAGAEARKNIGLRARERIEKHFNISACVSKYEELYERILVC